MKRQGERKSLLWYNIISFMKSRLLIVIFLLFVTPIFFKFLQNLVTQTVVSVTINVLPENFRNVQETYK